nr:LysR family transcriptional regulator [Pseudonocardia sp. C8]
MRQLVAFVAVGEELHFGRAAARLHVAQSPLSRQIRALERRLGTTLFERSTRSVRLTAEGEALLHHARRVLDEVALAERSVRAAGEGAVGRVSIGFAGASSYDVLPRLTRAVTSDLPGVELVLQGQTYSGQALNEVADSELDIGFVAMPVRAGISARVVRLETLTVALPDTHPLAARESVALPELAGESFVSFPAGRGSAVRATADRACFDAGFTPRVAQEVPDSYTLLTLVGAEVGVALVVSSARRIRTDHVVFRPIGDGAPVMPIALAWRADNPSRAVRAVLSVAERVLPTPT